MHGALEIQLLSIGFESHLSLEVTATLDYLQERVPKLFVNLVTPPNVTILQDLASPWCDFTHLLECKCGTVFGEKNREFTSHVLDQYDKGYADLINSGR